MGRSQWSRLAAAAGLAAVLSAAGWIAAAEGPGSYAIDPAHSSATFQIEHLGISWVAGRFNEISGKAAFDRDNPAASSCEVVIKATSIDTAIEKRDAHLRSEDFLSVKEFPEIVFKSTAVKKVAAAQPGADTAYEVTGDFTLHGVTKPVTLVLHGGKEAEFPEGAHRIGFFGEFAIKRSDFGMAKMLGPVGDVVRITVSAEAIRK